MRTQKQINKMRKYFKNPDEEFFILQWWELGLAILTALILGLLLYAM